MANTSVVRGFLFHLSLDKCILRYTVPFLVLCSCLLLCFGEDCKIIDSTKTENDLLQQLNPLKGEMFVTEDKDENTTYTYYVKICASVHEGLGDNIGAAQYPSNGNKNYSLGRIDSVDVMAGTDWILLTYYNGDKYGGHCNYSARLTKIMIVCDPLQIKGKFTILEERRRTNTEYCFYLFELGSSVACIKTPSKPPQGLSSGSVFCIIFFTIAGIYLLIGFLYQRLVIGAKGLEQIPNYSFWRDFGNLQADGCDYFCRCGPRQESQAYRGIDDRIRREEERDDQLLNM